MAEKIRTICNRDCPDSCGIIATVEAGRVVGHRGDPDHGVTRGFLCRKGRRYLRRFYSEDRILHPLRRTGGGEWQPISWDDALDLAAEKLLEYREAFGAQSVLVVSYSGIKGAVARSLGRLFWSHFGGATFTKGGLSVEACWAAQKRDFGGEATHAPDDLQNAEAFVVWGKNIAITRPHCLPFVNRARKRGAPLHVIDPIRSSTARRADHHYQIRPGSDGILALGIARLLIEQGALEVEFIEQCCNGYDAFERLALSVDLAEVARATDLEPRQIERLADLYGRAKPLATLVGLGPAYWRNSGATIRAIDALAAITGNIGVSGGGAHADIDGSAGLDFSFLKSAPKQKTRKFLLPRLGDEILNTTDPFIKLGWIAGANPAATCPDTDRVAQGLASIDFLVVVDQFLTASAANAQLFLPCTTYLEMADVVTAYGHHWVGLCQPVVPPLGEARSDGDIYRGLAQRLGFGEVFAREPLDWAQKLLDPLAWQGLSVQSLTDEGPKLNPACEPIPFADRKFATPSGKVELTCEPLRGAAPVAGDELHLVATKTLNMVNAQIDDEELPDEPIVRLHPGTLLARGFASGDQAWIVSRAGRVQVGLQADETLRRDVALFNPAAWRGDFQGVNQLRESILTDVAGAAAMHETRVTLEALSE